MAVMVRFPCVVAFVCRSFLQYSGSWFLISGAQCPDRTPKPPTNYYSESIGYFSSFSTDLLKVPTQNHNLLLLETCLSFVRDSHARVTYHIHSFCSGPLQLRWDWGKCLDVYGDMTHNSPSVVPVEASTSGVWNSTFLKVMWMDDAYMYRAQCLTSIRHGKKERTKERKKRSVSHMWGWKAQGMSTVLIGESLDHMTNELH